MKIESYQLILERFLPIKYESPGTENLETSNKILQKWKKEWASSHTPRSNMAWEGCIQWMAIPSIRDGQSDKKGDIYCSSKGSNQHFLYKCISTHNVLHNYKVSRNSVEQFQWSCANKKNRTDWLTDWLTDWVTDWLTAGRVKNFIPYATPCVGYNNYE